MRNILITIMLITIMVLNFFDVLFDISMGAPSWHIISESLIVIVSGIGAILLIKDINEKISNI